MKKNLLRMGMLCLMLLTVFVAKAQESAAQEKQLFYTDFTDWTNAKAATSESTVTKSTKYSHETLTFSIFNTQISSTNQNTGRFPNWEGGYAMANKSDNPYITTSALASITKVHFKHGATGSNRGWKLEAKGDGDADWVVLSNAVANPAAGADVDVEVNKTNVQLRFTNLNSSQNAYLFELTIWGNVDMGSTPVLDSFTANGTTYNAADIFAEKSETEQTATVLISKTATMISIDNPLTGVTAANGEVGDITYEATATQCVATIPVTYGDKTVNYVVTFAQKPDYTLTYVNADGTTIGTQLVEQDAAIGSFAYDATSVEVTTKDKFRGWFVSANGGRKYTTDEVITANTTLYAYVTEIERESTTKTYIYNLTDKYFYAEDHEGFVVTGQGKFHDTTHGWEFKAGDKVNILVGGNAYILFDLCKYSSSGTITLSNAAGDELGSVNVSAATDGAAGAIKYEGGAGTLTLTFPNGGYLHKLTVANTQDRPIAQNEAGYYIVSAGDANHFLATLTIANAASTDDSRSVIYLPNGTYDLGSACLTPVNGKNISIVGQSMDGVVIKNTPEAEGIGVTATLYNTSNNLYLQDLTLQNALDYYDATVAGRAVCLQDKGDKTIAKRVRMLSYQDTYYSNSPKNDAQLYWEDSDIHGTVDFLCGGGDVRFQNTTLTLEKRQANGEGGRTISAPTTKTDFGYVFDGCKIVDLSEGKGNWNYARAWQNKANAIYLNTTLDAVAVNTIASSRWTAGGMNTVANKFLEYNTMDESGKVVSPSSNVITFTYTDKDTKVTTTNKLETILTAEQAEAYSYEKMFTNWDPKALAAQLTASAPTINGAVVSWDAVEDAKAYAVFVDGQLQGITKETTLTLATAPADDTVVSVRAANSMGGFGEAASVTTGIRAISENTANVAAISYFTTNGMQVEKPMAGVSIRVKTLSDGQKVAEKIIVR